MSCWAVFTSQNADWERNVHINTSINYFSLQLKNTFKCTVRICIKSRVSSIPSHCYPTLHLRCIPVWWVYCLEPQGSNKSIISFSKPFKRLMSAELLSWANDALLSKPELDRPSVTFWLSVSVTLLPGLVPQKHLPKTAFLCWQEQRDTHTEFMWMCD